MRLPRPARLLAGRAARAALDGLDERYRLFGRVRRESSRVTPSHHSFFWGRLAAVSFAVLLLSGIVLSLFFVPDKADVVYHGPYGNLRGAHVSRAYKSVLDITFSVRGGLLLRQVHHWAALLFLMSMTLHMARTFFTGAFRKPRETTWLTGAVMLIVALVEGYTGYAMLDDLLSGQSVRIFSGVLLSIPLFGTWLHWMVFGGEYEGDLWLPRFFFGHVFVLPAVLGTLIAVHLGLVWYQRLTHMPGPGAREHTIVGFRAVRHFGGRTLAYAACAVGVMTIMGGILQIEPVWLWGPYSPAEVSTFVQPDWYLGYVIGALKLFPAWTIHLGPYTVPAPFWPAAVMPLGMLFLLAVYPYAERVTTKDHGLRNLLQRPRDAPVRTALGVFAVTFYLVLMVCGADDFLASMFEVPFEWIVWGGRVGVFVVPLTAAVIAYRVCAGLRRRDADALEHGVPTGLLEERPDGTFTELRVPPGGVDEEGRPIPLAYGGVPVTRRVPPGPERRTGGNSASGTQDGHDRG